MQIKLKAKRAVRDDEMLDVDVVEALRERAAEHVRRHLNKAPRNEELQGTYCPEEVKPLNLWTAKLCLEIANLFQLTEKR